MHPTHIVPLSSLPRSLPTASRAAQGAAKVVGVRKEGGWWLHFDASEVAATRAASCLVEPVIGDLVWMVRDSAHDPSAYILAVLVQPGSQSTILSVDGDLELRAPRGRVQVQAERGVALRTPGRIHLTAGDLTAQAKTSRLSFGEVTAVAETVFASLRRVTRVGAILDLFIDTVTQHSRHSVRTITGVDHTQAGTLDYEAKGDVHIRGQRTLINGEQLIKMDGDQIHLG